MTVAEDEHDVPRAEALRARLLSRVCQGLGVAAPGLSVVPAPDDGAVEAADARILELEDERDALRRQLAAASAERQRLSSRVNDLLDDLSKANRWVHHLLEPAAGVEGECQKIRLRSESEARAFAEQLFEDRGDQTEPYKCPTCPRQPLRSAPPFYHVRNVDKTMRGDAGRQARLQDRIEAPLTQRLDVSGLLDQS